MDGSSRGLRDALRAHREKARGEALLMRAKLELAARRGWFGQFGEFGWRGWRAATGAKTAGTETGSAGQLRARAVGVAVFAVQICILLESDGL
ncbi:Os04g0638750 [Oryza sativa Japonica Group]|uniref:Os04g0638750 protein n=1 Tax=Oryza sativa subsp. japonica TaxID=39947 RepID=A0A0P0WFG5_ORYSJ|nr:Os04g0638750 [Oryza sativa Japonica Group]